MMPWSSPRGARTIGALIVTATVAVAPMSVGGLSPAIAATVSASDSAPAKANGSVRVEVTSPAQGAVVLARSRDAAQAARVPATVKLNGPVQSLTVTLNGTPLPVRGHGTQKLTLDAGHGLRVGANEIFVSAAVKGQTAPVQYVDRFVVGYPVSDLLTTSGLKTGAGEAPAATLSLQGPLAGVSQTTAKLNGRSATLPDARRSTADRRSLALNLAQLGALRPGKNTFDLRLVMDDGRVQDVHHTFTLDKKRDIAVAALQGPAAVGRPLSVDASRSRIATGQLDAHWVLLHKPVGSTAQLGAATGTTNTFTPDVPGTYSVVLRTGSGPTAGYDLLEIDAAPATPLVPIDTEATQNGTPGLRVGAQFYPYDDQPTQITVLDRYTLQMDYHWGSGTTNADYANDLSSFDELSDRQLAIITVRDPAALSAPGAGDLASLDRVLQRIGGSLGGNWQFNNPGCWQGHTYTCTKFDSGKKNTWTLNHYDDRPFTVIGAHDMPAGQAWRTNADVSPSGRFTGYLTTSVATQGGVSGEYVAVPGITDGNGDFDGYQSIDTCTNADGHTCAVTVGDKVYPSPGTDGIHVVVLKRGDLGVVLNTTATTIPQLHAAINTSTSGAPYANQKAVHFVTGGGQSDARIVIMQSVGDGKVTGTPMSYVWQDLSILGGTPEALQASLDGSHRYALIGAATDLPWRGTAIESSTVMDVGTAPGQPTGQIDGVVSRDRTGMYVPTTGNPSGKMNGDLYDIMFQAHQDWPYEGDPALKFIADALNMSGYPDVRSAYENAGFDFASKAGMLRGLSCTGDATVCGDDFDAVKAELLLEFDWVQSVRNLIDYLLAPYSQNGSGQVFAAEAVFDDIQNSVPPPANKGVQLDWWGTVTGMIGLASKLVPGAAAPTSAAITIIGTGMQIGEAFMAAADGGDAGQVVADSGDKLAVELANQQSTAVKSYDQMEAVLLADYGKMKSISEKLGSGEPGWDLTPQGISAAIDGLTVSTRAQSYTTLVPMTWAATDLEPSPQGKNDTVTNNTDKYRCQDKVISNPYGLDTHYPQYPFEHSLAANEFQALSRVEPDGSIMNDVWTFTQHVGSGTTVPNKSLTDKIYGPDSRGSDGAYQYGPSWWRSTFNPPSGIVCYPPDGEAQVWNIPPNIPLPLP